MARVYTAERLAAAWPRRSSAASSASSRTDPQREQDWKSYAKTVLVFSVVFSALLYVLLRLQGHLFLNPDGLPASRRTSR